MKQRERRFILENTSLEQFAQALMKLTCDLSYSRSFPAGRGRLCLQTATQHWTRIKIDAFYITPDGPESEKAIYIGSVIAFDTLKVSDDRMAVTASCSHPAALNYFENELMTEIETFYPSARERVEAEADIEGQAEKHPDSGHYAYAPDDRQRIVEHFREQRAAGKITNIDAWVQSEHGITSKTLLKYRQEFPNTEP